MDYTLDPGAFLGAVQQIEIEGAPGSLIGVRMYVSPNQEYGDFASDCAAPDAHQRGAWPYCDLAVECTSVNDLSGIGNQLEDRVAFGVGDKGSIERSVFGVLGGGCAQKSNAAMHGVVLRYRMRFRNASSQEVAIVPRLNARNVGAAWTGAVEGLLTSALPVNGQVQNLPPATGAVALGGVKLPPNTDDLPVEVRLSVGGPSAMPVDLVVAAQKIITP